MLGEVVERLRVLLLGLTDAVVVVGVHHRAETDLIEDFGEEAAEDAAVEDVGARDVVIEGLGGLDGLAADTWVELRGLVREETLEVILRQVQLHDAIDLQSAEGREVDELRGAEGGREFHREVVAIHAE